MTPRDKARRQAMAFIAAYDRPDAPEEDRTIVRIARTWLSILGARHSVQGIVDALIEALFDPERTDGGCGWDDLRRHVAHWAVAEQWIDPDDPRLHRGGRAS
jgi:hypothetical protein